MKFTPKYTVSYKGVFHTGGVPFEIEEADAAAMEAHGVLEAPTPPREQGEVHNEKPARRAGRPRKAVTG